MSDSATAASDPERGRFRDGRRRACSGTCRARGRAVRSPRRGAPRRRSRPPRRSAAARRRRRMPAAEPERGHPRRPSSRRSPAAGVAIAGGAAIARPADRRTRRGSGPGRGRAALSADAARQAACRVLAPRLRGERHRDGGDGRLQPDAGAVPVRAAAALHRRPAPAEPRRPGHDPQRPAGALPLDRAGHAARTRSTELQDSSTEIGIVAIVAGLWIGASFWGAMDTAFCRIYHVQCRGWLEQKRFSLIMLVVVALFLTASVAAAGDREPRRSPASTTCRSGSTASTGSSTPCS